MAVDRETGVADLKRSEQKYRSAFENAPYGIVIFDTKGTIIDCNPKTEILFGFKPEDLIGRNYLDLKVYPSEVLSSLKDRLDKLFMGEAAQSIELEITKPNGEIAWLRSKTSKIQVGNEILIQSILQNITKEKDVELKLQSIQARYQAMYNQSIYCLYVHDFQGQFIDANDAALKLLGFTRDEIPFINFHTLVEGEELAKAFKLLEELKDKGFEEIPSMFKLKRKDGKIIWVETESTLIYKEGKPFAVQGIARDVSEQKRAVLKLKESEELYRSILRTSPDAITVGDKKGNIIEVSERTAEVHGFDDVKELLGMSAYDLIDKADHKKATKKLMETISGQMTGPEEFILLRKDKTKFIGELVGGVLKDAAGRPRGVTVVTRDITERKIVERQLNQSKLITDNLNEALIVFEDDGLVSFVNPAFEKMTGFHPKELIGQHILEITKKTVVSDDVEKIYGAFNQALQGTELPTIFSYFKHKGGNKIPIEFSVSYIRNDKGRVTQVLTVITDITERKKAEQEIKQSEEKYRNLVENINEVIYMVDRNGILTYISPTVESFIGYVPSEVEGRPFTEFILKEDLPGLIESYQNVLAGQSASNEYRVRTKSGEIRWMRTSSQPILSEASVIGVQGILMDITERLKTEQMLKESELKFRHLFEKSPLTKFLISVDGIVVDCNSGIERTLGFEKEEIIGKEFSKLNIIPSKYLSLISRQFRNVVEKGYTVPFELQVRKKNDNLVWVFAEGSLVDLTDKSLVEVVLQDINERKLAEERLKESEEKYRLITENANDLIIVHNQDRKLEYVNEASAQKVLGYGYNTLKTKTMQEFFHPSDISKVQAAMMDAFQTGQAMGEYRMQKKDGTYLWTETITRVFHDDLGKVKVLTIARDISERKAFEESRKNYTQDLEREVESKTLELKKEKEELQKILESLKTTQEQLIQSEKLASIGLLAAGIAHEINNPLMGIINYAQIVKDELATNSEIELDLKPYSFLESLIKEGERIAEIVQGLLTFAREDKGQFIFADVSEIINSALSLLIPKIKRSMIDIHLDYDANLSPIPMQTRNMRQVILNIVQNSIDALNTRFGEYAEKGLKKISIETSLMEENEKKYGKIIIWDNGQGIKQKDITRVFDPFFTTKIASKEHGMGLGLSISYGTIKDHVGKINIQSVWEEYTQVEILLPLEREKKLTESEGEK